MASSDNPDEVYCGNTLAYVPRLSLETEHTFACVYERKMAQADFVLQGVNVLRASVQVWKLGMFPRS